jgi:hypothetical protein
MSYISDSFYVYIFLSESYLQFNHYLTSNAFYHIQLIITNAICQWQATQKPNKTTPPMVRQCLHPAAPLLPATSPISRLLLASRCPMLVLAIAALRLASHPALISAPLTVQTK